MVLALTVKPHFRAFLTFAFATFDDELIEKQTISKVDMIKIIENSNAVFSFFLVIYK